MSFLLPRVLQTSCFQKPYQMKNTFLLVYRNAMTSFSHFDTSKYLYTLANSDDSDVSATDTTGIFGQILNYINS